MDYFEKYDKNPFEDLKWNIPERRQGSIAVIGGNGQNFRTVVKIAEWIGRNYPVESINVVLPDVLKGKLPPVPGLVFLKSTESGSFANTGELEKAIEQTDCSLLIGDLSKNAGTAKAIASACKSSEKPLLISRDTVDLLVENQPERALMNEQLVIFASMPQLQKLFKAIYYPRMLMLSQSLIQIAETLHKFTLSYPTKIITLHSEQVLAAENGKVVAVPLEKTGFSPITVWGGEEAGKIMVYNLYNPNNFMKATVSALFDN